MKEPQTPPNVIHKAEELESARYDMEDFLQEEVNLAWWKKNFRGLGPEARFFPIPNQINITLERQMQNMEETVLEIDRAMAEIDRIEKNIDEEEE